MRKGLDGLYGLIRGRMGCDPESGHVVLFANARRNRLKLVFFDGSGLWVAAKRMEGGRLRWPAADTTVTKIMLRHEELALLLGGIDLKQTQRRRGYRKPLAEEPSKLRMPA
jgi:transposase